MSKPYAEVIGDPVTHSKSPLIHRFWLGKRGLEGDYFATRVQTHELGDFFKSRSKDPDWRGCNVTVPHKQAVIPFLDSVFPLAVEIGAVNLVVAASQLGGGNSDVAGIVESLQDFASGGLRQACLIGSGGAALAALGAFRRLGVERVTMNVRDQAKGARLLADWNFDGRVGPVDDRDNIMNAQLIVNASTLGMTGHAPMPESLLGHVAAHPDDRAMAFDMVYAPVETDLLAVARRRGLRTADGLAMLIGQASSSFEAFFGWPAPREHDAELRMLLTA
jgi:shikimate dehydrogenase